MSKLTIHNWDKWQSYRSDRGQPPWIKIHREVMRHVEWVSLTDAQRGQLVAIWLLAADHNGVIPASPSVIKKLCHLDSEPDLQLFIEHGFIDGVVTMASDRRQDDQPDKRQSREEEDKRRGREESAEPFVLPEWIDKDHWDLWVKSRKKMNPDQKRMQVEKLRKWKDDGLDYKAALFNAAANGTQGLFLPNGQVSKQAKYNPTQEIFDKIKKAQDGQIIDIN